MKIGARRGIPQFPKLGNAPSGPDFQKIIFAANWITRGFAAPDTVPKFDWRTSWPPVTANCAVRIDDELVRLKRLNKLNASKIN